MKVINEIFAWVVVFIVGAFITITPLFMLDWYERTVYIQGLFTEGFQEFSRVDINWSEFDINQDPRELHDELREVIFMLSGSHTVLWFGETRKYSYSYRESIFDVIDILFNQPGNHDALMAEINDAKEIQTDLYEAAEDASTNILRVMPHTF